MGRGKLQAAATAAEPLCGRRPAPPSLGGRSAQAPGPRSAGNLGGWGPPTLVSFVGRQCSPSLTGPSRAVGVTPPWWWVSMPSGAMGCGPRSAPLVHRRGLFTGRARSAVAGWPPRFVRLPLAVIVSSQNGSGDTSGWPLILPNNANALPTTVSGIFFSIPTLPEPAGSPEL